MYSQNFGHACEIKTLPTLQPIAYELRRVLVLGFANAGVRNYPLGVRCRAAVMRPLQDLGDTGLMLAGPMSVIHQTGHSGTLAEVGRRSHRRRSIDYMGLPRDRSCAPQRRPSLTPSG